MLRLIGHAAANHLRALQSEAFIRWARVRFLVSTPTSPASPITSMSAPCQTAPAWPGDSPPRSPSTFFGSASQRDSCPKSASCVSGLGGAVVAGAMRLSAEPVAVQEAAEAQFAPRPLSRSSSALELPAWQGPALSPCRSVEYLDGRPSQLARASGSAVWRAQPLQSTPASVSLLSPTQSGPNPARQVAAQGTEASVAAAIGPAASAAVQRLERWAGFARPSSGPEAEWPSLSRASAPLPEALGVDVASAVASFTEDAKSLRACKPNFCGGVDPFATSVAFPWVCNPQATEDGAMQRLRTAAMMSSAASESVSVGDCSPETLHREPVAQVPRSAAVGAWRP